MSEAERSSVTIEGLVPYEFLPPRDIRLAQFSRKIAKEMGLSPLSTDKLLTYADNLFRVGEIDESPGKTVKHVYHNEDGSLIGTNMTHPQDAETHKGMLLTSSEIIH